MTDPRGAVSFDEEIKPGDVVTIAHDDTIVYSATTANGSAQVGLAVTLESDKTVSLVGDGENVFGKLLEVEPDGFCVVQRRGTVTLPGGTSAGLTAGKKIVGDLLVAAEGYIREVNTATAAELGVCRGMIIDATTTTAVVVDLG